MKREIKRIRIREKGNKTERRKEDRNKGGRGWGGRGKHKLKE